MIEEDSTLLQIVFIVLVTLIFILTMNFIRKIWPEKMQYWGFGIVSWLGLLIAYSQTSFIHNFTIKPPPVLLVIIAPTLFVLILALRKNASKIYLSINTFIPVIIQSFRIIIELLLWGLYCKGFLPKQMTFEGLNFDILIGVSAIPFAYFIKRNMITRQAIIAWNIIGILFLLNIAIIAFLSAPTPFRVFMNEPANTIITHFPFIWLPGFIVPFALFMHVISIRQMLNHASK